MSKIEGDYEPHARSVDDPYAGDANILDVNMEQETKMLDLINRV